MQINPVVILFKIGQWVWKLGMKTPEWAISWIILPIITVLVMGSIFAIVW